MAQESTVDWNEGRRLDEVELFGGRLTFLIPHEWVVNEEEKKATDFCSYVSPALPSGWFRASLITINNVADPEERLQGLFAGQDYDIEEENGNFVARSEKESSEDGRALRILCWAVGNFVRPDVVREALFSYTVLADALNERDIQREIELIDKLVRQAQFS